MLSLSRIQDRRIQVKSTVCSTFARRQGGRARRVIVAAWRRRRIDVHCPFVAAVMARRLAPVRCAIAGSVTRKHARVEHGGPSHEADDQRGQDERPERNAHIIYHTRPNALELKRAVIVVHRWLGVGLCLLFLIWFASGIGMMYWDFPTVTPADRLERSPALTASTIALSPENAYVKLQSRQPPSAVRLNTFDGRPVYRFRTGRADAIVYADTGEVQREVSRAMVDRIASAWTGRPVAEAGIDAMTSADQWTVQGPLQSLRPLWKFSWPTGEQVYVAETSGEVVQYTTPASGRGG
jgi:hypothetical protein